MKPQKKNISLLLYYIIILLLKYRVPNFFSSMIKTIMSGFKNFLLYVLKYNIAINYFNIIYYDQYVI